MRTILLATTACAALAFPALAQTQTPSTNAPAAQRAPMDSSGQSATPQTQGSQAQGSQTQTQSNAMGGIDPASLNRSQIEQVQRALDRDGFSTGRVDGIWGPTTEAALQKFQQSKAMATANGQLDSSTLSALQLDATQFPQMQGSNGMGRAGNPGGAGTSGASANGSMNGGGSMNNGAAGSGAKTP